MDRLRKLRVAPHPVAVAPDVDDVAPMEHPVEQCSGHDLVAEDPAPLLEALVRRQHGRGVAVAPVDELEEEDGATLGDRQVADLVDDQECRVGQRLEAAVEPAGRLGLLQRVHQVGQGSEVDLAPVLGRRDRQADRQVRLADPGRTRDVVLTNPVLSSTIGGTRYAVESWMFAGATSGAARAALSSSFLTGPGARSPSG